MFYCLNEHGVADDKINAVCADDPEHRHFNNIKELPTHCLAEIRRFFEDCILLIVDDFLLCSLTFRHSMKNTSSTMPVYNRDPMEVCGVMQLASLQHYKDNILSRRRRS
jgi:inorganic pyrophosphatase